MKTFNKFSEDTTTSSVVGTGDDSDTVIVRKKYDKKRKGKITKDHKNFKSIKLEEIKKLEDIEDFKNGSIPTIHTQE